MMNFIFGMQINIEVFYKLILSFWLYITRHAQGTQNNKLAYLCIISRNWLYEIAVWNWFFADKHKYFLQVDSTLWVWVYIAWHVQTTENIKFTISLQYFKENLKDEVEFCLLIIVKGFFKVILSLSF